MKKLILLFVALLLGSVLSAQQITADQIKETDDLRELYNLLNPESPLKGKVVSFELLVKIESNRLISVINSGNEFSDEAKKALSYIQPGTTIWIDNIVIKRMGKTLKPEHQKVEL